tara:strand:+ start:5921 stop:6988 length:1068 start_codon:yes stop_codon:yes gene_type:complete
MDIGAVVDYGTKYTQTISALTPRDNVDDDGTRMEDDYDIVDLSDDAICIVCADGHGSIEIAPGCFRGGYESAAAAVDAVRRNVGQAFSDPAELFERANEAVRNVDLSMDGHATFEKATEGGAAVLRVGGHSASAFFGTTLTTVALERDAVLVSHVGDSLACFVPERGDPVMLHDAHTVENEEEHRRVVEMGARRAKRRSSRTASRGHACLQKRYVYPTGKCAYECALTRSLGHFGNPAILYTPEVAQAQLHDGFVVVATDGVWDHVGLDDIASICRSSDDMQEAAHGIMEKVKLSAARSRDNATVVCVRVPLVSAEPEVEEQKEEEEGREERDEPPAPQAPPEAPRRAHGCCSLM